MVMMSSATTSLINNENGKDIVVSEVKSFFVFFFRLVLMILPSVLKFVVVEIKFVAMRMFTMKSVCWGF